MVLDEKEGRKSITLKTGTRDGRGVPVSTPWRRSPGLGPDKKTGKSPTAQSKQR